MKKRVLVVANTDWLLAHFRLPLLKALRREGLELILISPPGEYVKLLQSEGFQWEPWHMTRNSLSPLSMLRSVFELIRYYRAYQPAAVHQITIQSIFYGSIAARLTDVPVVINNYTGLGYLFSQAKQAAWLRRATLPILRWAAHREGVFSVLLNKQDQRELVDRRIISEHCSLIIPGEGIDLQRFQPADEVRDQEPLVVLMAARLLWDKGVEDYLMAAAAVKGKDQEVQFWLAGAPDPGNPSSIPEEILAIWKEQGEVHFLGYREDMADLLQKVGVAVLPSYHEGVPVFLLEAAASGLPIIASDLEGCRSIVTEGENGFLVPPGDVVYLTEKLLELIRQPDLRERMGLKSRVIVEKHYDQELIVSQFLGFYSRLGLIQGDHRKEGPAVSPLC